MCFVTVFFFLLCLKCKCMNLYAGCLFFKILDLIPLLFIYFCLNLFCIMEVKIWILKVYFQYCFCCLWMPRLKETVIVVFLLRKIRLCVQDQNQSYLIYWEESMIWKLKLMKKVIYIIREMNFLRTNWRQCRCWLVQEEVALFGNGSCSP